MPKGRSVPLIFIAIVSRKDFLALCLNNMQRLFPINTINKQPSLTVKKSAPAIGQNRSGDFRLSVTNYIINVTNVNLCFLI